MNIFTKIPTLKKTEDSNYPTNRYLDNKIEQFNFILQAAYPLLKDIVSGKFKRFVKYGYKKFLLKVFYILTVVILLYVLSTKLVEPIISVQKVQIKDTVYIDIKKVKLKTFDQFILDVGKMESGNKWTITNGTMMGYFQFSPSTLKLIGITVSKEDFLKNKELQIGAFKQLLRENRKAYKKYIDEYNNTTINGKYISESGILMAFHLKPDDAICFFDSKGTEAGSGDANGTTVLQYISLFSGYNLNDIE